METSLALVALTAPFALLLVAALSLREPGRDPRRVTAAARFASLVSLVAAAVSALLVVWRGPLITPTLGVADVGLSLRLDALSVSMLLLVAGLGAAVLRFSRRYLDGNRRHGAFLGLLAATIASVMLLVVSGNVAQLALLWFLTSMALHRLLLFRPDRRGAVVAARKKWIVARLGDVCLLAAAVLLVVRFGTGDIGAILAAAGTAALEGSVGALHAAAALVALSAVLKSAQFPAHGWLAEVMETPTPVSALLHAGILNGGTFLIVRLGEVMVLSQPTLYALLIVGGLTSVFASLVMITQTSIKVSLAYSSAAHMGFMLFLCGLGSFPVAILHLIAHSFYKAHAFLASGSVIDAKRASPGPDGAGAPSSLEIGAALSAALIGVLVTGSLFGATFQGDPVSLGLCAVLAIGLAHLLTPTFTGRPSLVLVGRSALAGLGTTVAFFGLEKGAVLVLAGSVPGPLAAGTGTTTLMIAVVLVYALAVVVQLRLPALRSSPGWSGAWVHLRNGLYANALLDRLVGAYDAPLPSRLPSTDPEITR